MEGLWEAGDDGKWRIRSGSTAASGGPLCAFSCTSSGGAPDPIRTTQDDDGRASGGGGRQEVADVSTRRIRRDPSRRRVMEAVDGSAPWPWLLDLLGIKDKVDGEKRRESRQRGYVLLLRRRLCYPDSGLVQSVVQQLKALRARHQISSKIQGLKTRVEDASKRCMRYKLDERTFEPSISRAIDPRLPSLYAEPDGLVGIDKPRDELIKCLMEGMGASLQQKKVLSIVGPGGLGKTNLANEGYRKLEGQFQCRAFVCLSQQPDVNKILRNILSQVCQQELPITSV
ncbi:Disease resistance protein RPM1 [Hordeum vulgare]|nr:Disease resistance protein RPM1 [Hordeum vulgare]